MTDERKTAPSSSLPRLADLRAIDSESKFDCMLIALNAATMLFTDDGFKGALHYIDYVMKYAQEPVITYDQWSHKDWALFDISILKRLRSVIAAGFESRKRCEAACKGSDADEKKAATAQWGRFHVRMMDMYSRFLKAADWSSRIESPGLYKKLCAGELA